MTERELCERCGYPIPSRRRGLSYCTQRCEREQAEADRVSAEMEEAEVQATEDVNRGT